MGDEHLEGSDLESRAAYLSGLVKGLGLAGVSEEGRVLEQVVEFLGDITREVARLRAEADRSGTSPTREATPEGLEPSGRTTFIACECPECGEEIFVQADSMAGEPDSEDIYSGQVGGPRELHPREFEVTCPNCGNILFLREQSAIPAWQPDGPVGPPPDEPRRTPGRRPRRRPYRPRRRPEGPDH